MSIQFDTLRYAEKLRLAGIQEAQAKARTEALATALGEASSGLLATKDGITNLKIEKIGIKSELKLVTWMLAAIVTGVASLFAHAV